MPLCSLLPPCSVPADGYLRQIIPPQGPFVKYFSPIPSSKASFRGVSPGLAGAPRKKQPTIRKNSLRSFLLMRACGNCVTAQATLPTTPFAKTLPVVVFLLMRACGNSVPAHPHSNKKPASVLESKLSGRWPVLFVRGWEGVTLPLPSFAPRRPSSPARSRWRI